MSNLRSALGYFFLRTFFGIPTNGSKKPARPTSYAERLREIVDSDLIEQFKDRVVVDYGCGTGEGVVELAKLGFQNVVGIDIRESVLNLGRALAEEAGVGDRCEFRTALPEGHADLILSIDAFEHFEEPGAVIESMAEMLTDEGRVVASFGPTWYHPRGGHLYSMFPWAHLLFSEASLCRWRSNFRDDGAQKFSEVEGGLNQMTIKRFENLVSNSPLQVAYFAPRPIGRVKKLHNRWTREFFTSVVDCVLVKKQ